MLGAQYDFRKYLVLCNYIRTWFCVDIFNWINLSPGPIDTCYRLRVMSIICEYSQMKTVGPGVKCPFTDGASNGAYLLIGLGHFRMILNYEIYDC